ncbi:MAG: DUF2892 domain-containing protein [Caulobacteraceae bacterium]
MMQTFYKQNLGNTDRVIRVFIGLLMTALALQYHVTLLRSVFYILLIGGFFIALEGAIGY